MKCIYCSNPSNPRGQGDHIIPAALGEFLGDTHFRRICVACNSKIGQAEQQLLQCGPEALERLALSVVGRRSRRRGKPALVGAGGMPPPETVHETDDGPRTLEMLSPGNFSPVDEVTILDENGNWHRLRLRAEITAGSLRHKVRGLHIKEIRRCNLHAAQHYDHYLRLFKEAWPESEHVSYGQEPVGVKRAEAKTWFRVTHDYFRALAKIAFHHYLVFSSGALGHEPEFEGIRSFIIHGGDQKDFFVKAEHFEVRAWRGCPHTHYSHYVAYDESGDRVRAYVWLFAREGFVTCAYEIEWPRRETPLILPRPNGAHEYRYEATGAGTHAAGRVYKKCVLRMAGQKFLTIL
ncbi:MAG: hypothetical protein NTX87_09550 [Planctomycetota bacterium]|nr:hypothetical protein [Planctomycetota bacterium]